MTLGKIVELFVTLHDVKRDPLPNEHASYETARDRGFFLVNPNNETRFVYIVGRTDDEQIPPDVLAYYERSLGLVIPKPWDVTH